MSSDFTEKLEQICNCGYDLLEYLTLHEDTWWIEYYAPLEKRINKIRTEHTNDPKALAMLNNDQQFIDVFKKNPGQFRSAFFILKKS